MRLPVFEHSKFCIRLNKKKKLPNKKIDIYTEKKMKKRTAECTGKISDEIQKRTFGVKANERLSPLVFSLCFVDKKFFRNLSDLAGSRTDTHTEPHVRTFVRIRTLTQSKSRAALRHRTSFFSFFFLPLLYPLICVHRWFYRWISIALHSFERVCIGFQVEGGSFALEATA